MIVTQQCLIGPAGLTGINEVLKAMRVLARQGAKDPAVRDTAQRLIRGLSQKDFLGEARALFMFVRDNIRYTRDIEGVETLQTPRATLQIKQGDCDDKSILLAALLLSIGHPARFMAIGPKRGIFNHVLVQVSIRGKWYSLETTEPYSFGQSPKAVSYLFVQV